MRLPNPLSLKRPQVNDAVLFAASQLRGGRETQEDYFVNYNDECFVVADGVGGLPHGEVAAKFASETAIWGYKHIRQRPFYWRDKKHFVKRIFRSANIAVWQKQRESGFEDGMATTLLVCFVGSRMFWIGSVGDSRAYHYRADILKPLTKDDVDSTGRLTKAIGVRRYGLVPQFATDDFRDNEVLLLATDGVTSCVDEPTIRSILSRTGATTQSLTDAVVELLDQAQTHGSTDNMTALIVKRIPLVA